MLRKVMLAAGVAAMAAMFAPVGATAAPAMPQSRTVDVGTGSLVQKAQYGRCRYWRHECQPLGLAHARLLPLPGAARLLKPAVHNSRRKLTGGDRADLSPPIAFAARVSARRR